MKNLLDTDQLAESFAVPLIENIENIKVGEDELIHFSVAFSPSSLAWSNKQQLAIDVKLNKHLHNT